MSASPKRENNILRKQGDGGREGLGLPIKTAVTTQVGKENLKGEYIL